jgi:hypothetical protein
VLFLLRKTSRVLNLLSTGTNHENYASKKKNKKKNYYYDQSKNVQYGNNKNKSCIHCHNNLTFSDKSIHAEEMALDKIKINRQKKLINVSLLVIRITVGSTKNCYNLANSRPCIGCMYKIKNITKFGYKISKIYFSNEKGDIICYKLRDIIAEKQFISTYYRSFNIPRNYIREFQIENYVKKKSVPDLSV